MTPYHWSHTWRTRMAPEWIFWGWGQSWHHGSHLSVIPVSCDNFQLSCINKSVERTPWIWSHYLGMLMVPNYILGSWGHSWCHRSQLYVIQEKCANCRLSGINKIGFRKTCLLSPTWRMLMVPDWILQKWDNFGHHG